MSIVSWSKGALIGQGGYGKVYLCINNATGGLFAVKDVVALPTADRRLEELENEIAVLSHLQHPQIVTYLGARRAGHTLSIFMEYVPGGCLADILQHFGCLAEPVAVLYTSQLLLGLQYLHQLHYVHRDVKAANVLVGVDGSVKLSDFGTALKVRDICQMQREERSIGTTAYMSPERARKQLIGPQTDIWALGCIVLEMLTGVLQAAQFSNHLAALLAVKRPALPESLSAAAREFLDLCFTEEDTRPGATTLLAHEFVTCAPSSPAGEVSHNEPPPPLNGGQTASTDISESTSADMSATRSAEATAPAVPAHQVHLPMPYSDLEAQRTSSEPPAPQESKKHGVHEYTQLLLLLVLGLLALLGMSTYALLRARESEAEEVAPVFRLRRLLHHDDGASHFYEPTPPRHACVWMQSTTPHVPLTALLTAALAVVVRVYRACTRTKVVVPVAKSPAQLYDIQQFLQARRLSYITSSRRPSPERS